MGRHINNHNKGEWTSQYRKNNFPKHNAYEPSPKVEVLRGDVPHTDLAKLLLMYATLVSTIRTGDNISSIPKIPNNTSVENQSILSNAVKNSTEISKQLPALNNTDIMITQSSYMNLLPKQKSYSTQFKVGKNPTKLEDILSVVTKSAITQEKVFIQNELLSSYLDVNEEQSPKVKRAVQDSDRWNGSLNPRYSQGVQDIIDKTLDGKVRSLDLSGNNIGDQGAKDLGIELKNSNVLSLDLSGNNIGDQGAKDLGIELKNSNVLSLNLSGNNIGDQGAHDLITELKNSTVRYLYLTFNNSNILLDIIIDDFDLTDYDQSSTNATIEETNLRGYGTETVKNNVISLDLSGNKGEQGAKDLVTELKNTQVIFLNLSGNNIGDQGVKDLATELKNSNVRSLDLSGNNIGDQGVKDLATELKNSNVRSLDLSGNNIGDQGVKDLATELKNSNVRSLDLSGNNIRDQGAKDLGIELKSNVISLYLSGNNIGDQGAKDLGIELKNSTVRYLSLSGNNIGDQGAKDLVTELKNSTVRYLYLTFNNSNILLDLIIDDFDLTDDNSYTKIITSMMESSTANPIIEEQNPHDRDTSIELPTFVNLIGEEIIDDGSLASAIPNMS